MVMFATCSGRSVHLVTASAGSIGLEYREGGMCRLEFSVCVAMRGRGRMNVAVES